MQARDARFLRTTSVFGGRSFLSGINPNFKQPTYAVTMPKITTIFADDGEGSILATAIPRWLRELTAVWAVLVLYGAKYYAEYGENQILLRKIEQLPYAPMLVLTVLGVLSCAPCVAVQYGSRRWLRKYYPEVEALRWNNEGITLSDKRHVPWRDVKEIRDCSKIRNPRIEIYTNTFSDGGKICIPTTLLLYPDQAYQDLNSKLWNYRKEINSLKRKDVRTDENVRAEVQKKLIEALGKPASQLRAQGIPTADMFAIKSYFWDEAAKREQSKLARK